MAVELSGWREAAARRAARAVRVRFLRFSRKFSSYFRFNSITRRIIVLNFFGVAILVSGIFYLNQYRVKFIETRVESLTTQAAIIASAIAQTSKNADPAVEASPADDENKIVVPHGISSPELAFRIDPEIVSPMLRDLVGPTKTRARVFDMDGSLISDSRQLYPRIQSGRFERPEGDAGRLGEFWTYLRGGLWIPDLPIYKDMGPDGKAYDEVRVALAGSPAPLIRITETGETVISVAMPIQRDQTTLGALMLTTQGSDIDDLIAQERLQIVAIAGLVVLVTGVLSLLLAGTIAEPMHRLAVAAERVRKNIKNREQIPDFSDRPDEIGNLSRALRDMTNALYSRLDAIESFAADVSHELKNPLTSLRSAASLLPAIKAEADRQKLVDIINHDVRRLDRLITDISDASRLDAELAREIAKPVNMASLLYTLCEITRENRLEDGLNLVLSVQGCSTPEQFAKSKDYYVSGHDSRLSQVVVNLIENAISFSPKAGGSIYVSAKRIPGSREIEISVEDEGPGISDENLEKIFNRFYTDRPESFGQNSGLGLNISQQIVRAHKGTLWAENRLCPGPAGRPRRGKKSKRAAAQACPPAIRGKEEAFACGVMERYSYGARFVIRLPA